MSPVIKEQPKIFQLFDFWVEYLKYPSKKLKTPNGKKLTWHFKAPKVHDFTWAADPDYIHEKVRGENEVELHFFYKNDNLIYLENMY
mgnify:CR=1 FL=1